MRFKQFLKEQLILEGGAATAKWNTKRAAKQDIVDAIAFVSKNLNIPVDELTNSMLGSGHVTLSGKKESSGDIDLAIKADGKEIEKIMKIMASATNNEVYWNAAGKVASYAVPTKSGKVQVDLMFMKDDKSVEWSKFAYHSEEGDKSLYSGTVRNLLLVSIAQIKQEPGKDFIIHDKDDNIVARASRSYKLNTGLERLFKLAPKRKDGKGRVKGAGKISPAELEKEMTELQPNTKFSHDADPINDPQEAVDWLFGKGVKPADVITAEQIIKLVKSDRFTPEQQKHIFANCRKHFANSDDKVPSEFN